MKKYLLTLLFVPFFILTAQNASAGYFEYIFQDKAERDLNMLSKIIKADCEEIAPGNDDSDNFIFPKFKYLEGDPTCEYGDFNFSFRNFKIGRHSGISVNIFDGKEKTKKQFINSGISTKALVTKAFRNTIYREISKDRFEKDCNSFSDNDEFILTSNITEDREFCNITYQDGTDKRYSYFSFQNLKINDVIDKMKRTFKGEKSLSLPIKSQIVEGIRDSEGNIKPQFKQVKTLEEIEVRIKKLEEKIKEIMDKIQNDIDKEVEKK